jgi:hypothetical protein
MAINYGYFKENTAAIKSVKEIKSINNNNIATLYERPWLKFRDIKHWTVQESPCTELMALAREAGIRPQTTANGIKNMFFIHERDVAVFLKYLENKYPEFAKFAVQKMLRQRKQF